uniref:PH domain-containing protein n=2 Tax=Chaetoceros debilis TaxID=122233 RepID=A0A7S3Q480_9STRA
MDNGHVHRRTFSGASSHTAGTAGSVSIRSLADSPSSESDTDDIISNNSNSNSNSNNNREYSHNPNRNYKNIKRDDESSIFDDLSAYGEGGSRTTMNVRSRSSNHGSRGGNNHMNGHGSGSGNGNGISYNGHRNPPIMRPLHEQGDNNDHNVNHNTGHGHNHDHDGHHQRQFDYQRGVDGGGGHTTRPSSFFKRAQKENKQVRVRQISHGHSTRTGTSSGSDQQRQDQDQLWIKEQHQLYESISVEGMMAPSDINDNGSVCFKSRQSTFESTASSSVAGPARDRERERDRDRDDFIEASEQSDGQIQNDDMASLKSGRSGRSRHSHLSNQSASHQSQHTGVSSLTGVTFMSRDGRYKYPQQQLRSNTRPEQQQQEQEPLINNRTASPIDSNRHQKDPSTTDAVVMKKVNARQKSNMNTNTNTNRLILHASNGMDEMQVSVGAPGSSANVDTSSTVTSASATSIMTNTTNNIRRRNETFKNLLTSTVNQLPRPRLLPFSPMLSNAGTSSGATKNPSTSDSASSITAASFARHAPKAGYLSKLGGSVSEYKRRFFVLKPTTCLYYFLDPSDEEPRGCIDLDLDDEYDDYFDDDDDNEYDVHSNHTGNTKTSNKKERERGLKVNSLGSLPDGRFRFEVLLPIKGGGASSTRSVDGSEEGSHVSSQRQPQYRKILLEARNEDVGREWMNSLTVERLSYSKAMARRLEKQVNALQDENITLKKKVEDLRLAEKDRDGAIDDARAWRERSNNLDRGLVILKRWVNRPVAVNDDKETNSCDESRSVKSKGSQFSISKEDKELDEIDLPGTNFASLSNACRGLRENVRLTSAETISSLDDLHKANAKIKALEERMAKAEKHMCKMWEENCTLRDSSKKKKSEKKVLINHITELAKENQMLREVDGSVRSDGGSPRSRGSDNLSRANEELDKIRPTGKRQLSSPEKKLLFDLEEHVNCSLRDLGQHEYLLDQNDEYDDEFKDIEAIRTPDKLRHGNVQEHPSLAMTTKTSNSRKDGPDMGELPHKVFEARDGDSSSEEESSCGTNKKRSDRALSPLRPKHLSLMDQVALDEAKTQKKTALFDSLSLTSTASLSTANQDRLISPQRTESNLSSKVMHEGKFHADSNCEAAVLDKSDDKENEPRINPLDYLNGDESIHNPSDYSSKSLITDNGKATSRLACPLKDVAQIAPSQNQPGIFTGGGVHVYSLTFYTPKIGLQFQKVVNNNRPAGILTAAMTADLGDDQETKSATAALRTDAELRLIASLSDRRSHISNISKKEVPLQDQVCPVILPKDVILVCGFQGFDEASNNRKPSLGARLVGFDGISIERGPWTFDTVRKAIKARERPLTLTFRNEYLNVEQRSILTKAACQVEQSTPKQPPRPQSYRDNVPIVIDASSKCYDARGFGRSPSVSELTLQRFGPGDFNDDTCSTLDASISQCSPANFSDAGSSSTFSTRFSHVIPGLLTGLSRTDKKKDGDAPFTPEYLRRSPDSLDSILRHKEFKASLL